MSAFLAWLLGGIVTSLFASYLKSPVDRALANLSSRLRRRSERLSKRDRAAIDFLAHDDTELLFETIEAHDNRLAGLFDLAVVFALWYLMSVDDLGGAHRWLRGSLWTVIIFESVSAMVYLSVAVKQRQLARAAAVLRIEKRRRPADEGDD